MSLAACDVPLAIVAGARGAASGADGVAGLVLSLGADTATGVLVRGLLAAAGVGGVAFAGAGCAT